jgi:hypothetical protein
MYRTLDNKFEIRIKKTRQGVNGRRKRGEREEHAKFFIDATGTWMHVVLISNITLKCLIAGSLPSWKVRV